MYMFCLLFCRVCKLAITLVRLIVLVKEIYVSNQAKEATTNTSNTIFVKTGEARANMLIIVSFL